MEDIIEEIDRGCGRHPDWDDPHGKGQCRVCKP